MRKALSIYGINFDAKGWAICPFHEEKNKSFMVKPNDVRFHCFGCGAHGDLVDFVSKLYRLNKMAAISKINNDFKLNLPINRKITNKEKNEIEKTEAAIKQRIQKRKNQIENAWREFERIDIKWWLMRTIINELAPEAPDAPFKPEFVWAINNISQTAYALECAKSELTDAYRRMYN